MRGWYSTTIAAFSISSTVDRIFPRLNARRLLSVAWATILIEGEKAGIGRMQKSHASRTRPGSRKFTQVSMLQPMFKGGSAHFPAQTPWLSARTAEPFANLLIVRLNFIGDRSKPMKPRD